MSETKNAQRLQILDLLRGLAALGVCWFHLTLVYPKDSWLHHTGTYGRLGVDVFFVVSGFIVPYSMSRSGYLVSDYFTFQKKRLWRLYPPYVACVILIIFLDNLSSIAPGFAGTAPKFSTTQILANLTYTAEFFHKPWIGLVFWTLAIEFQFYISIGIIYSVFERSSKSILVLALVLSAGLLIRERSLIFMYFGFFAVGTSVYLVNAKKIGEFGFFFLLVFSGIVLAINFDSTEGVVAIAVALFIRYARFKVPKTLLTLGAISYSLYLVHVPIGGRVVNIGRRILSDDWGWLFLSLLAASISLFVALIFHRYIERPSQEKSSRVRYRSKVNL